jgi:hypothetical protein
MNSQQARQFEVSAANHCLAQFYATGNAADWEAYKILAEREFRHSMASVSNSEHDLTSRARKRYCGRWTMRGRNRKEEIYSRVSCKCWDCTHCGPRKAGRYKHAIRVAAEKHQLRRFCTLTLDPAIVSDEPVRYIKACWAKFRTQLKRKFGEVPKFICVMEFQKQTQMPHLHILFDRYIEQPWIKSAWQAVGGGQHVDIRAVDLHRVSRYLSKYLTKELLMSAPKRSRRVTVSRGITLNEKKEKTHTWVMLDCTIFLMYRKLAALASKVVHGADAALQSFVINLNPAPAAL